MLSRQAAGACNSRPWHLEEPSAAIPAAASLGWRGQLPPRPLAASTRLWLRGLQFSTLCALISTNSSSCRQVLRCWAQNELCAVQALAVELPSGSILFGTQYHPEFTLSVAAGLIEMRAADLVAEGFGRDCAELVAMARDFRALHAEPERRDLAWRYGVGPEILEPVRRTAEIGNWLRLRQALSTPERKCISGPE
jgi:hypothetical protein